MKLPVIEIVEVARQGPPGPPGVIDPAALAQAITDWLAANGLPGAVRYDVTQQFKTNDLERAQENLKLTQAIAAWMVANGGSGGTDHFRGFIADSVANVVKPSEFSPPAVWGDYIIALGYAGEPEMFMVEQVRDLWTYPRIIPAPSVVETNTFSANASEDLSAGSFVNLHSNSGVFSARLADSANALAAEGFVKDDVSAEEAVTVYPLGAINSGLAALSVGATYWLGAEGGVIATPLDESDSNNDGFVSQYLGKAKSATELITVRDNPVIL
jgi:hypothetical protein